MSTSAEVEAAWLENIWQHDTLIAITDKFNFFPIVEDSETDLAKAYDTSGSTRKINFFEILTGRGQQYIETQNTIGNTIQYNYTVQVSYFLETEPTGDNFLSVRDTLETILGLVISELGDTWDSTVDYWKPDLNPPQITQIFFDKKPVWKGVQNYFATKRTEL